MNNIHFLETEFNNNDLRINLEDSLHHYFDKFLEKGYTFSHIERFNDLDELNISTINDTKSMTYEYKIHKPMPCIQRRINIILAKYPHC